MTLNLLLAATAGAFDVDTATRAYLDTVSGPVRARSDAYFEGGYWMLLWGTLISVLINGLVLHLGWSSRWSRAASRRTKRPWLRTILYALPYILVTGLMVMPWVIYGDYFREHQYGMSTQTLSGFLGDQGKSLLVSLIIGPLVAAAIYGVIRRAPRTWWLWGTGVVVGFMTFGALLAPVFIAPMFNSYTPMAEGPVRQQILAMARANKVPADNVYVVDASRQTNRISANVSGLGPTVRISLNDNLLNRTSPEEVKAVMGHELGHYVLNHVIKMLLAFTVVVLAVFLFLWWATPRLLLRYGGRWGVRDVADPASMPALVLLTALAMLVATPFTNSIIRHNENEADAFGLDAAREPDGFAHVAMRLSEYRKLEPGALEEMIFFDHPSGYNRAHRAMEWKARHLAELPPAKRAMAKPELLTVAN